MSRYRGQVSLALRAVAVKSASSYAWFGRASRPLSPAQATTYDDAALREHLIGRLEDELYRSFYCPGRPVPTRPQDAQAVRPDSAFVETLASCNHGRGGWDPGWRVELRDGPALQVARAGLRVRVTAADCRPAGTAAGATVSLRRPKEQRAVSPGFYLALGDTERVDDDAAIDLRVYFHLTAAGATLLVATVTRLLNAARLPFALKVVDHPAGYTRCDAAVLYLRSGDFAPAQDALRASVSACASHLRSDPPPFTKPLRRGVGVAEHLAGHGASFGTSRCRLLAEGIVTGHERGASGLPDRVEAVARCFAERGLDLDRPYLIAGSSDGYEL